MAMNLSHLAVFLAFFLATASAPFSAAAQIASPVNAGQNSGNNASASSTTSIGTPNFSQPLTVSLVAGVSVDADGELIADPELEEAIRQALQDAVSRAPTTPLPAVAAAPLPSELKTLLLASAADIPVGTLAAGPSAVVMQNQVLLIPVAGELVELPVTAANQAALRAYVEQALQAGFTPSSLQLGAQLVAIGAPVEPTLQLTGSLQGLASQPSLTALARGIAAFNTIVNGASPRLRAQLNSSPVFIAASNALRTARSAMPSQQR